MASGCGDKQHNTSGAHAYPAHLTHPPLTQASSNFTCDGEFSWVTLDPALASISGGDAAGAVAAPIRLSQQLECTCT